MQTWSKKLLDTVEFESAFTMELHSKPPESPQVEARPRSTVSLLACLAMSGIGILVYGLLVLRFNGLSEFSVTGPLLSLSLLALASSLWVARITIDGVSQANSLEPAARQVRALRMRILFSFLMTPLLAAYLNSGSLNVLLGIALANTVMLEAIPIAALVVRRHVDVVLAILLLQGAAILLFLALAPSKSGIATMLLIPLLATLAGGLILTMVALWLNSLTPEPSADGDLWSPRPTHLRPPGASVCAPILVVMFEARHSLSSISAGVMSLAALLGTGVVLVAGLGIATWMAPPVGDERRAIIIRGAEASLFVAAGLAGAAIWLGPLILPSVIGSPIPGLFGDLIPLCLAGLAWSVVTFASWVSVSRGGSGYPFVVASGMAVTLEILLGSLTTSARLIALLPFAGVTVFLLAFLVTSVHRDPLDEALQPREVAKQNVSVGILAYNEERNIVSSLSSFLSQTSQAATIAEILVISSASTDGTDDAVRRIAQTDNRIRLIVEEEKQGKVFSVARFLAEAKYPICIVASADVTPASDCVDLLVRPMLFEAKVAMTGPRVEPRYRKGFVPLIHRYLWTLHNHTNSLSEQAKLGEIIAVRRDLANFEPVAGCDEVLIEASVTKAGGTLRYVPEAVVYNLSPTNLAEYVQHRRRIHAMHLSTEKVLGYEAATVNTRQGVVTLLSEVLRQPYLLAPALACAAAEAWGRALGRRDVLRGATNVTWQPTHSARTATHDTPTST